MTIIEAVNKVDNLVPNTFLLIDKINWLSQIDARITREILDTHIPYPCTELVPFHPYTEETPEDTELIAPVPYDELYLYFLQMQIDYYNGEYDKYNNSSQMFNNAYKEYRNFYNKTHIPKSARNRYF